MAGANNCEFVVQGATFIDAGAVAAPLFNRLKLGSIVGYIAAGVVAGPYALNLLHAEEGVFHVAELGVVLFLFIIGLEMSLSRLWSMRRSIFGLGAAQMGATGLVIGAAAYVSGYFSLAGAIIAGLTLSFSSTAIALQLLKDRGELNAPHGQRALPVLLFQDIAVIPLLAVIPFLAAEGAAAPNADGYGDAILAFGVIAAIILVGRYAINPVLRLVAASGSREAFAATALLIVAATSLAVSSAGLSMALGAFLAGVLLAESAYRHQIETDIEPFRGLLLGLFFISIGMRLDLSVIARYWPIVVAAAIGLVFVKAAVLYGVARLFGDQHKTALNTAAYVSQGGEFAFVVFGIGAASGIFNGPAASLLAAIVTLSMLTTALATLAARRFTADGPASADGLEGPRREADHVIIVGFGRVGQIVSQVLLNSGVRVTAIDRNPDHIRNAERFGFKVFYGDGGRLDTLITAGALDARGVVLTMDDQEAVNRAVELLKDRIPGLPVFVIAHDRMHEIALRPLGPDVIVRETLESSLRMAREALEILGYGRDQIDEFIEEFRKTDRERLLAQADYGPEAGKDLIHRRYPSAAAES
ncbi:MAG: monovalent cation:proton antiporter-2 (CPA2) family protein [Parvularculaceae bacterium]|nr:monovalent cation:proton antiporter-2 (CPA2) family protein [Parvularculaceae bacterium]